MTSLNLRYLRKGPASNTVTLREGLRLPHMNFAGWRWEETV